MKTIKSFSDQIFEGSIWLVLLFLLVIMILPFLNILSMAVSESWAVTAGKVGIWPIGFQLDTLIYVVTTAQFVNSFVISVVVTAVGTIFALFMTVLAAYPLSKKHLPGMKVFILLYVFTMLFNGGMIPNYLLIKSLGLVNNLGSLIFPMMINVFNMLIVKNYFEGVPESLEESARIEGATNLTVLFRIILPVSGPILATIGLFCAVGFWNDFFSPMLYISVPNLRPLQLYLSEVIKEMGSATAGLDLDFINNLSPEGIRSALVVGATVPILLVYPFIQKHFTKGVLVGSIKG